MNSFHTPNLFYCLKRLFLFSPPYNPQTEIKEEIKDEPVTVPLGPDDPLEEDENSWEDQEGGEEAGKETMYRKVTGLHPPPPGLHPVVSSSGLTHSTPVLPLGLFRVGSYAVVRV